MAVIAPAPIAPGAHLVLRDAVWRVTRVVTTSAGSPAWYCTGISEIVRDREAVFLSELEPDVTVLAPETTALVRDESPGHLAARLYLETLLRDVPPTDARLHIGDRAAMDVMEYQLTPATRALSRPRARILIADAVGLGKTLEAGILLAELVRRGQARRILVATVKSMMTQFQKELWCRFGLPLVRLDSAGLQRVRADLPAHHNPFHHYDRAIISIDTLKQDNGFRRHVEQARWDVVVIDEAHNVAERGRDRSQRARIARTLSENCEHLILLSATPHDGRPESFASLMNMLDPTAIADPKHYTRDDIDGLFVRRFKKDVAQEIGGHFPERRIERVYATATPAEETAFSALAALDLKHGEKQSGTGLALFKVTLTKALFSSPSACLETIDARLATLGRSTAETARHDEAELRDFRIAVEAIAFHDFSKYAKLKEILRTFLEWTPRSATDRLVIFSERVATLGFLRDALTADLTLEPGQLEVLHGGGDVEQQRIVEEFGKKQAKVRLLLASDVASEGLNLHWQCCKMVHFDVPWSLMVFQQRNGRIDRYGQTRQPRIAYLLTESGVPTIRGDQRILEVLVEKDEQARKNLGDPAALMNQYDEAGEEAVTANAMARGLTPEAFGAELDALAAEGNDWLSALLLAPEDTSTPQATPSRATLPSLFTTDFEFLWAGLDHLRAVAPGGLRADVKPLERLIELHCPDDLLRRFKRLPREIEPKDGVVLLTDDAAHMQRKMDEARKEEIAWPRQHWLCANSPVLHWLGDRLRATFGRHEAPVLFAPGVAPAGGAVFLVSGVYANRLGQPLVHTWYAVTLADGVPSSVRPFAEALPTLGLAASLSNPDRAVDLGRLKALLPRVVAAARVALAAEREAWLSAHEPAMHAELERLEGRRGRQLEMFAPATTDLAPTREAKSTRRDRVERTYQRLLQWTQDARTPVATPFIQIVGVLAGG